MKQMLAFVSDLLGELSGEAMTPLPPDGGWNIRNILTHLRDSQDGLVYRLDLFEQQSRPILASKAIYECAAQENQRPQTGRAIFETYREVRAKLVVRLEQMPLADW